MKKESAFQHDLITALRDRYPDCMIIKNDANYIQGIPDLLVLFNERWAMLECKRSENEHHQPNQDYYISHLNEMSYATFVYPENLDKVFGELDELFGVK